MRGKVECLLGRFNKREIRPFEKEIVGPTK